MSLDRLSPNTQTLLDLFAGSLNEINGLINCEQANAFVFDEEMIKIIEETSSQSQFNDHCMKLTIGSQSAV